MTRACLFCFTCEAIRSFLAPSPPHQPIRPFCASITPFSIFGSFHTTHRPHIIPIPVKPQYQLARTYPTPPLYPTFILNTPSPHSPYLTHPTPLTQLRASASRSSPLLQVLSPLSLCSIGSQRISALSHPNRSNGMPPSQHVSCHRLSTSQ